MSAPTNPAGARAMLTAAIVGLGWWGRTILQSLAGSERIRVVAAVTTSEQGRAIAHAQGLAATGDYAEVLRDGGIDAVILCTPNALHLAQTRAAAAAGKHVFCEKPLALTAADAAAAVAACEAACVVLGIGHERRFEPAMMALLRHVADGTLGTPLLVEANFSQDRFRELRPGNWRLSETEAPAGPLTATGVHLLDLAIALLGPAERVFAGVGRRSGAMPNGDTLAAMIGFRNGAQALIGASLACPFASRFAVYGSTGWAEAVELAHPDHPEGARLTLARRGHRPEIVAYKPAPAVRANLEAFAAAAEGHARYPIPRGEMIATVALLEACAASAAAGTVVAVRGPDHPAS
ncbi:MAG: Gfo/Idh/MocA family oxidoreductase [Rhodospirillales bacterium]|nr:Gfo/Idh/MocA family oxidoreductase [Rhodospirillales bacterium]